MIEKACEENGEVCEVDDFQFKLKNFKNENQNYDFYENFSLRIEF